MEKKGKNLPKIKVENSRVKTFSFHNLTSCRVGVMDGGCDFLFDCLGVDSLKLYNIRPFDTVDLYRNDTFIYCYNNCSIFMNWYFRNNDIPVRCQLVYDELCRDLYDYLKITNSRVSNPKVKSTVRHFIKHVSRLKFHGKYLIKYTRNKSHWNKPKFNPSFSYMMSLIYMLEEDGKVKSVSGFRFGSTNHKDVTSVLIVNPNFIDWCNGSKADNTPKIMDNCLREPKIDPVEIRVKTNTNPKNKKEYKVIMPKTPKDKIFYAQAKYFVDKYNETLEKRVVEVGGFKVPELFFRRIFSEDLEHGARFYDRSEIQGKNETIRSTIMIDGEPTIELDFHALHYSLVAEKEGLDLRGKDPYSFDFNATVDYDKISKWKENNNINHSYDPVRNLKKTALLIMFNADSKSVAMAAIRDALFKDMKNKDESLRRFVGLDNVDTKELISKVIEHNKEVSQYFNSGIGLHLQYLDSQIIEYCIGEFLNIGEVCLPVHDSLIVKSHLFDFTKKTMEDGYLRVMGSKVNCKIK